MLIFQNTVQKHLSSYQNSRLAQIKKENSIDDVLYFYWIHGSNTSIIGQLSYRCLDHIYLAMGLLRDYYRLGFSDKDYVSRFLFRECSEIVVGRTSKLDEYTRKQIFLACHEVISSFKLTPSNLTPKQQIFYDAIMSKDFTAWNLAAKLWINN